MKAIISKPTYILLSFLLIVAFTLVKGQGGTRVGFYARTCPRAEAIVRLTVQRHFLSNPAIAPGILRMHFHDCFSQGCDASILINGSNAEKTAVPNLSLRGFDVIDDAKTQLEAACPGVVSCADILTLAARDSVVLTNGPRWAVPTGRRDGTVSQASDASTLPGPRDSVEEQKRKFAIMGLNTQDLVTLVGGHTIGTTSCNVFKNRLFNFTVTGSPDPTINPAFLSQLQSLCPQNGDGTLRVGLDNSSQNRFDTSFFSNVRSGRAILESDQFLWSDASTRPLVQRLFGRGVFNNEFARAMVKMSNIQVKTGSQGQIRRVCSTVN